MTLNELYFYEKHMAEVLLHEKKAHFSVLIKKGGDGGCLEI